MTVAQFGIAVRAPFVRSRTAVRAVQRAFVCVGASPTGGTAAAKGDPMRTLHRRLLFVSLAFGGLVSSSLVGCSGDSSGGPSAAPPGGETPDGEGTVEGEARSSDGGAAGTKDAGKKDAATEPSTLRVAQVALGAGHSCALLSDGRVKCWGLNRAGQLGLGDEDDRGDAPGEMGAALPAVDLGPGRTAKELALLAQSSCALLDDGTVKCWGEQRPITGADVEIGIAPGEMGAALAPLALPGKVKHLAAGYQHLCAVFEDGATRCWGGANSEGQLGAGDKVARYAGGALVAVDLGAGRTAKALRPSTYHTCALLDDATVKCWGDGTEGELGDESKAGRVTPGGAVNLGAGRTVKALASSAQTILASTPVGYNCAVLDDGRVKCWGYDSAGLGIGSVPNTYAHKGDQPGEMGDALPAVDLGAGKKAVAIAVGQSLVPYVAMSCAILEGGSLKCWGFNDWGTLGVGDRQARGGTLASMGDALAPIDLGAGVKVTSVAVSSGYAQQLTACAITDLGRLKCWGGNKNGQLGLGDVAIRGESPGQMGGALPYVNLW